jgi:hypothetical protein
VLPSVPPDFRTTTANIPVDALTIVLNTAQLNMGVGQGIYYTIGNETFSLVIKSFLSDNKTIEFGSETFYISRSTKNSYGDYFYSIQEARGYGWPEIGYVKIASNFEIVELKFFIIFIKKIIS